MVLFWTTTFPALPIVWIPSPLLATAPAPLTSVPMRFPWMVTVPVELSTRTPVVLPEMTFARSAPMEVELPPFTTWTPIVFATEPVPLMLTPIQLPLIRVPVTPSSRMPSVCPPMTFVLPGEVPPTALVDELPVIQTPFGEGRAEVPLPATPRLQPATPLFEAPAMMTS